MAALTIGSSLASVCVCVCACVTEIGYLTYDLLRSSNQKAVARFRVSLFGPMPTARKSPTFATLVIVVWKYILELGSQLFMLACFISCRWILGGS